MHSFKLRLVFFIGNLNSFDINNIFHSKKPNSKQINWHKETWPNLKKKQKSQPTQLNGNFTNRIAAKTSKSQTLQFYTYLIFWSLPKLVHIKILEYTFWWSAVFENQHWLTLRERYIYYYLCNMGPIKKLTYEAERSFCAFFNFKNHSGDKQITWQFLFLLKWARSMG